ncbi:hypothetical protein P280DRAFT_469727 [Massarina eburnea CBS 473.64]|uniref:Uncharacterized protein n=1 Tax=Massarina eburnea CBS 473.64 TaxID=1395130 RepID=A0A6A6RYY0_9PLEO|nr:hypothetical protein P280DRAFT_469727 [Massarina eburnea CBS 473.64]
MSWQTELSSWMFPSYLATSDPPAVGSKAPSSPQFVMPATDGKPTIVTFLRHCGCPFAEKTYLSLRAAASQHPDVHCIAISHSDAPSTDRWLQSLSDSSQDSAVNMVVDDERRIYAAWGLGVSSFWHVLNPWSLYSVYALGKQDNIWNRPTESGTRWQSAGSFAVAGDGTVKWSKPNVSADDVPDFEEALKALG